MNKKIAYFLYFILLIMIIICFGFILKSLNINVFNTATTKTQNAYIKANISGVNSNISGFIKEIYVSDYAKVKANDELFKIDCFDYENAKKQKELTLNIKQASLEELKIKEQISDENISLAKTKVHLKQTAFNNANSEYIRIKSLFNKNASSKKSLDDTLALYLAKKDELSLAKIELNNALFSKKLLLNDIKIQEENIKTVKNELEMADKNVSRCVIRASEDGQISEIQVGKNDYVNSNKVLTKLVSKEKYLIAYIKESELKKIKIGDKASFYVDALGKDFSGIVSEISPASGNELSVMKLDNSVGNFIKITQRIAVKVKITDDTKDLIAGMSAVLKVN